MFQSPRAINFCILSTVQWWISPVILNHSGRFQKVWWIFLGWQVFKSVNMIHIGIIDDASIALKYSVRFNIYHQIFACWFSYRACRLQLYIWWWWNIHHTCYPYCCFILEFWSLSYEDQYQRNRAMVLIWCYMAQMSVNEQITWRNQFVQYVIRVGGFL